jgi:large repetitive protein
VIVTAENMATRTYLLTVTRAKNGNTELSGLVPSVGTLAPVFKPSLPDYGFQAAFSDSLVRITPSAADSHSTIQVNGKALASGSASEYRKAHVGDNANLFIVVVTAENLAQKVYNVSVTRSPSSLSTLKSLAVSSGTLAQKSALEYADTVSHGTLSVTLAPVASDPNAVVTIDAKAVATGSASAAIPLAVGDNVIGCLVTAQDGETQTLYTVRVTRLALLTRNRLLGSQVSVLDSVEIPLGRPYQQSAPVVTGFHFVKWTTVEGSVAFADSNASATSVTLSLGDARIQAKYDTNTYTLTVNAANGAVARSPNLAAYNHGKSVVLTVTPASGFQFSSWADGNTSNPRTVSMVANTVLSVTCTAIPVYTLTLGASPSGSGSVAANPAGPEYFNGTSVSLTPAPATGYHFVNWTGDLTGSAVPGSISMTMNRSVTAHFAPDQYNLTLTVPVDVPFGCVTTPAGSVKVGNGTATSISAANCKRSVASCGSGTVYLYYDFTGWSSVSGTPVFASAGSASTTVTLSSGDATIKANYAPPRDECE